MTDTPVVAKKTIRKKTTPTVTTAPVENTSSVSVKNINSLLSSFSDLIEKISQGKGELEILQKQIQETKEEWIKTQKNHEKEIQERDQQEDLNRRRDKETFEYETVMSRKRQEDEFAERKAQWEKELREKKEEIQKDKEELTLLTKQVAGFEAEKEKAVKEAINTAQKALTEKFDNENKLSEQEHKSEKELLNLRINSLTTENSRQTSEIETLKKSLEEATRQVKEIAMKVIEAGSNSVKSSVAQTQ